MISSRVMSPVRFRLPPTDRSPVTEAAPETCTSTRLVAPLTVRMPETLTLRGLRSVPSRLTPSALMLVRPAPSPKNEAAVTEPTPVMSPPMYASLVTVRPTPAAVACT